MKKINPNYMKYIILTRRAVIVSGLLWRILFIKVSLEQRPVMKSAITSLKEIDWTLMFISQKS